jgi:hypothetical protein
MKHAPTPWKIEAKKRPYGSEGSYNIAFCGDISDGIGYIGQIYNRANAAFIVRACNAHDDLLAACKALVEYRDRAGALGFQLEKADDYINQIRAAIAAAEEG